MNAVDLVKMLADELAEHFPVSVAALAMCNDEATEDQLRDTIDAVACLSRENRLLALPERLRTPIRSFLADVELLGEQYRAAFK